MFRHALGGLGMVLDSYCVAMGFDEIVYFPYDTMTMISESAGMCKRAAVNPCKPWVANVLQNAPNRCRISTSHTYSLPHHANQGRYPTTRPIFPHSSPGQMSSCPRCVESTGFSLLSSEAL